jgi:hypothetical protein
MFYISPTGNKSPMLDNSPDQYPWTKDVREEETSKKEELLGYKKAVRVLHTTFIKI